MKKMERFEIMIPSLAALAHIDDRFEDFNEDLRQLGESKKGDVRKKVVKALNEKSSKKAQAFCDKYGDLLDTIETYTDLETFLSMNYTEKGKLNSYSSLQFYHDYIQDHPEEKYQIVDLIDRLYDLGFYSLTLDEGFDFTQDEHHLSPMFHKNTVITYLDNMKIDLTTDSSEVAYYTDASDYAITIGKYSIASDERFGKRISVKNLLFSKDRLPKSLTREDTFDEIIRLGRTHQEEKRVVGELAALDKSLIAYSTILDELSKRAEGLESEKLQEGIELGKKVLGMLETERLAQESKVIKRHEGITPAVLQKAKSGNKR